MHTCQKVDVHATVGSLVSTDLIIRGDKYARRAKAFSSVACLDTIKFQPEKNFQLVPGAYNRLSVIVNPIVAGSR